MNDQSFESLLSAHLDGALNEDEQQQFAQMLRDPAMTKRYVVACQMHAMLAWEHGAMPAPSVGAPKRRSWSMRLLPWFGCAAAVLVLSLIFWRSMDPGSSLDPLDWQQRSSAGTLARTRGAQLTVPGLNMSFREGDQLRVGDYELSRGFVEMNVDGVELTVESPAKFRLVSSDQMMLQAGRLTAWVPENGGQRKKFRVETACTAAAELLPGAETAVEAEPDASEFHVFEGEVDVVPGADQAPVRLTRSKATRVERGGSPAGVDLDADRFMRTLTEPQLEYFGAVRSLAPVVYLRMGTSPDGIMLPNSASDDAIGAARVFTEEKNRPAFTNGKIGAALRLGREHKTYATFEPHQPAPANLTVCVWVEARSRPRGAVLVSDLTSSGGQFRLGLHEDDGDLEVEVKDASGETIRIRTYEPMPIRSWQFVAVVFDGATLRMFVDGNEIGSAACHGLQMTGSPRLGIGVQLDANGRPLIDPANFHGRIDELAIFHRAVSMDELSHLFKVGIHSPYIGRRKMQAMMGPENPANANK